MNKRMKTRWLKALRSGKYTQGREVLRSGDNFCCLGVLCDLYDKSRWAGDCYGEDDAAGVCDVMPPGDVAEAAGLEDGTLNLLTKMNDGYETESIKRKSFKQIANWIEKHL